MALSAGGFLARKADFQGQGCQNGTSGCGKPAPYNAFDWTTDSCSWTPPTQKANFDRACQQHDFGFRNFGQGLTLERTEARRTAINDKFLVELRAICQPMGTFQRAVCNAEATTMYNVVSAASTW